MSYSIFTDTMADMTYQEIEQAAEEKQLVLFPIAVIEEHGPHLCCGTDTYLAHKFCKDIQKGLLDLGIKSVIAPPYYWGINVCTNGFAGSFTVRPETMISVLCDLLGCLKSWGFEKIILFNCHGDLKHNLTIAEAVKKAHEESGIGAYFMVSESFLMRSGLSSEPYFIVKFDKSSAEKNKHIPEYVDIHAGGWETSEMIRNFPELVDMDLVLHHLKSSYTTADQLKVWAKGGRKAREITPLGYCGNPSEINIKSAENTERSMCKEIPEIICEFLKIPKVIRASGADR